MQFAVAAQANTLQYSNGYVNVTGPHYRIVEHTQNRDVCAAACTSDAACAAWTRIAAGRQDVQACYLKSSIGDLGVSASPRLSAVGCPFWRACFIQLPKLAHLLLLRNLSHAV